MTAETYDCWNVSIILKPSPFFKKFKQYLQYLLLIVVIIMVRTKNQLENMSKKKLIDEVLDFESFKNDINSKYLVFNDRCNDLGVKYKNGEL